MTITKNIQVNDMAGPAGPVNTPGMRIARGTLVLVAGTATQAISGFPANSTVLVSRTVVGTAQGHLRGTYDGTNLVITSSDATETSTIMWALVD